MRDRGKLSGNGPLRRTIRAIALAALALAQVMPALAKPVPDTEATNAPGGFRDLDEFQRDWPKIAVSADRKVIYLSGILPPGSFIKVVEATQRAPNASILYLASPGGLTTEGRLIAGLVRRRGMSTYVEHQCASACTQIFAAGRERIAGPRARIGFHQSYVVTEDGTIMTEREVRARFGSRPRGSGTSGNMSMRRAYELAGFSGEFIQRALAIAPETMWFPSGEELLRAHVVTRRSVVAELPPAPGYGQSREETVRALQELPLWREFRTGQPQIYAEAVDEAWRQVNMGLPAEAARWRGRQRMIEYAMAKQRAASDALLDRFVRLYGETAAWERSHEYPTCVLDEKPVPSLPGTEMQDFARREDLLIVELLASKAWQAPLAPADARRQFNELSGSLRETGKLIEGTKNACHSGLQAIEAIAALDRGKRTRAWRAMLTLPDKD